MSATLPTGPLADGDADPSYGLGADAYRSAAWLALEQRGIFARSWHLAGHRDELRTPEDRLSLSTGAGRYIVGLDREGSLTARPSPNPGTDRSGRVPAGAPPSVEQWQGLLFLNPDPDAASLHPRLDSLAPALGGYELGRLAFAHRTSVRARCNWKLVVENHLDVLHLWYLHGGTLPTDHRRFRWRWTGSDWTSYEPLAGGRDRRWRFDRPVRHVEGSPAGDGIGAHLLLPNLLVTTLPECVILTSVRPLGPRDSELETISLSEPGASPTVPGEWIGRRVPGTVLDEDLSACEALQQTVASSRFAVGVLARSHERPLADFHRALLDALASGT